MLVLSRKLNETILIGTNIRIKVVGISGNQVRIGIDAPGDIKVMREELLSRRNEVLEPHASAEPRRNAPRRRAAAVIA
jgi:carbon storage regulator